MNCASCHWYELNPWTHHPALGAWCHYRMEPLVVGSPACEEFHWREVPLRNIHKKVSAVTPASAYLETSISEASPHQRRRPPDQPQLWPESQRRVGKVPKKKPGAV